VKVSGDRLINLSSWLYFDVSDLTFEFMCRKAIKVTRFRYNIIIISRYYHHPGYYAAYYHPKGHYWVVLDGLPTDQ